MKNKKLTVTVGIPAYNEEENIAGLLRSLLAQKLQSVHIRKIVVVSDGSTDQTVAQARLPADARIEVWDHAARKGKSTRLNEIFQITDKDVLIIMDADMLPASQNTVEILCQAFQDESFKGFVSGSKIPRPSRTITGTAVDNINRAYDIVRKKLSAGINIYAFGPSVWAMHPYVYRELYIPPELHCDDNYIYLACKQRGVTLRSQPDARVYYQNPQTIGDQIRQGGRFNSSADILSRYFDPGCIRSEFFIPFSLRLRMFWFQLSRNPIAYIWLKILSLGCQWQRLLIRSGTLQGTWTTVTSSKRIL